MTSTAQHPTSHPPDAPVHFLRRRRWTGGRPRERSQRGPPVHDLAPPRPYRGVSWPPQPPRRRPEDVAGWCPPRGWRRSVTASSPSPPPCSYWTSTPTDPGWATPCCWPGPATPPTG